MKKKADMDGANTDSSPVILIFAAPANCEAEDARILLMRCYQQDRSGVCSEAVLLDEEGCVWQYQSDDPLPGYR